MNAISTVKILQFLKKEYLLTNTAPQTLIKFHSYQKLLLNLNHLSEFGHLILLD